MPATRSAPAATDQLALPAPRPRRSRGPQADYDVVVVGAGAAGLSAALTLGRACRRVLVCDGGPPRNAPSPGVHAFLTRDGTPPAELLRLAREQLRPYETVQIQPLRVTAVSRQRGGFCVSAVAASDEGPAVPVTARRVVLCTGVVDEWPPLPGAAALWGRGVLHCPYCHGWEVRDQPLAVYGRGKTGYGLGLLVSRWSPDVVLLTDGPAGITPHGLARLRAQGVRRLDRQERPNLPTRHLRRRRPRPRPATSHHRGGRGELGRHQAQRRADEGRV